MTHPHRTRLRARPLPSGGIVLLALAALLAGCGSKTKTAAGNEVEMRDLEVVDGTANDAMTDLDAVKADGVGLGNAGAANSSRAPKLKTGEESGAKDAEAVSPE